MDIFLGLIPFISHCSNYPIVVTTKKTQVIYDYFNRILLFYLSGDYYNLDLRREPPKYKHIPYRFP